MNIFKANDIRGVYGSELKDDDAYAIGRATVAALKATDIIVGRDMRVSSPALAKALMQGIMDQGANVIDLDLIDTPGLYFATGHWKLPGIMVTASHNPAKDNGFVICKAEAISINEENGLKTIEKLVKKGEFKNPETKGKTKDGDISTEYQAHLLSFVNKNALKKMHVVIDAGNGMGGFIAPWAYDHLSIQVTPLYFHLDGTFPHHVPNPAIYENLHDLSAKVREVKADFGIAYDGDVDRAAFVDENGEIVEGSVTGAIIARYLLQKKPSNSIVYSSTCSRILPETVEKNKGKAVKEKVGHTFMKTRMREVKAIFGAENTGHFFYKDNYYADSGVITSLIMCMIYSQANKPFSKLAKEFKKYYKIEDVNFPTKDPEKALEKLIPLVKKDKPAKVDTFDGVFAQHENYWFSIRASQTEPLIRLSLEATSKETALEQKEKLTLFITEALK